MSVYRQFKDSLKKYSGRRITVCWTCFETIKVEQVQYDELTSYLFKRTETSSEPTSIEYCTCAKCIDKPSPRHF